MATNDDQPRPDLDAAVDAVLPSLTAVSDDATAASLRRTRVALADTAPVRGGAGSWRWAAPAAVLTMILLGVSIWWPKPPASDGSRVVVNTPAPPVPPSPSPAPAPGTVVSPAPAPRPVVPARVARTARVDATSAPLVNAPRPRPDPVVELARALQALPESAWNDATARTSAPIVAAELSVAPIVVAPLVTPPIADAPPVPPVQGEP